MIRKSACATAMATMLLSCGGSDSQACREIDEAGRQIQEMATQDNLSTTTGICLKSEGELELQVAQERARQYVALCQRITALSGQCKR
jgi:hypothetical protein